MMRHLLMPYLALALAGCTGAAATSPLAGFATEIAPSFPAECRTTGDPKWRDLPDGDIRRDDGAANYTSNRRSFIALQKRRRICAASLAAYTGSPSP